MLQKERSNSVMTDPRELEINKLEDDAVQGA